MPGEVKTSQDRLGQLEAEIRRLKSRLDRLSIGGELRAGQVTGVLPPANGGTGVQCSTLGGVSVWTNSSGGLLAAGSVVVASGNRTFNTTTAVANRLAIGAIAESSIANGVNGCVRHGGYQATVLVQGAVAQFDYLRTSATAGRAESMGATKGDGAFAIALTAFAGPGAGSVAAFMLMGDSHQATGGSTVDVEDEGTPLGAADTLDFVGAGVTATFGAGQATITIPGAGNTVAIEDEGSAEGAAATIDFVGAGVSVTFAAGEATVTIPGGAGDATLVNLLAENGGAWGSVQPPATTSGGAVTATPSTGIYRTGADAVATTLQGTGSLQEDADGFSVRYRQTTNGANSGWGMATAVGPHTLRQLPQVLLKWKLAYSGTGSPETRFFVGLTSVDLSTQVGADSPVASYIGIRFSEAGGAGDTNFQFVCDDGGAAPSVVDTTIAVDQNVHYLRITTVTSTSVLVELLNNAMVVQASQTFSIAGGHQLPATTDYLHPMGAQQNRAASQTNDVHNYYCHGVNKA